jgi:integrating conjugative element membrane protein (TIGR03747 family)
MATNPKDNTVAAATFAPFRFASRIVFSITLMWFMSLAVHITWVNFYKLPVESHMEQLIGFYVDRAAAKGFVERVANGAYWVVFEATSIQKLLSTPPAPKDDKIALAGAIRRGTWAAFKPELATAAYATVLYGVKLGVLALALPLLALLMLCFGVDGMVQRYIRRACGGHESASLYHRAKLYGTKLMPPFAAVIFLCSPIAFDPAWLLIPVTLFSALLLRVQATYYKKYL